MTSATICHRRPYFLLPLLFLTTAVTSAKEAFMVVEANSGRILVAHAAQDRKPVASLTKIATAMVVLDWAKATKTDLGVSAVVPPSAGLLGGANPMGLRAGDQISLRDALYSALLGSDNAAALTLAHHVGSALQRVRGQGGDPVQIFVREMNQLAGALGMKRTRFANPHGMDHAKERGHSTAADMARLCVYAMREPGFAFFVEQKRRKVSFLQGGQSLSFNVENTNKLLGQQHINGIKTGMTTLAGECLATSSELDSIVEKLPDGRSRITPRRLICVVLGSENRFGRTQGLVAQGWQLFDQWMKGGALVADPAREMLHVPIPK